MSDRRSITRAEAAAQRLAGGTTMGMNITLVSNDTLFRDGLRMILSLEKNVRNVDLLDHGPHVPDMIVRNRSDVTLLDTDDSPDRTLARLDAIVRTTPDARILVLGHYDEASFASETLRRGACGYLLKRLPRHHLLAALRMVADPAGPIVVVLSPEGTRAPRTRSPELLSRREREVIELVARARTNAQIGRMLGITEGTVKRHISSIFAKLNAVSRLDAVNKYTSGHQI